MSTAEPVQEFLEDIPRASRVECHLECHRDRKNRQTDANGREHRQKLEDAKLLTSRLLRCQRPYSLVFSTINSKTPTLSAILVFACLLSKSHEVDERRILSANVAPDALNR
jgi:hypothetical protein